MNQPNKSEFYNSNPNLKKANVPVNYTIEQMEEWDKCAEDVEYFISNYIKIVNVDSGLVPFKMYPYQKKMVKTFANSRFVITKMPRQTGKSTTVTAYMLWRILFHDSQNCVILANKGRLANDLLEKIKLAYEYLPKWLQQGVVTWNKGNIALENGSKVLAAATSSSAVRGGTYNCILLDEFAHVQNNLAEAFFNSVYPTISSGKTTQVIIVSTPLGMNHYYKMWVDAEEGRSEYVPIDVHWSEVPNYDEAWKIQTIKNTSERQFMQEFECEFLGSVNTLISAVKLRSMTWVNPKKDHLGVDVYHDPIEGHTYSITVDTAHGVGLDYSTFCVIDITSVPYQLAAKFRDNTVGPMIFPELIYATARRYNNAYVLVETNDVGQVVAESLHRELEYENVISTITGGQGKDRKVNSGFGPKSMFGIRTTPAVKKIGCANIRDIIEGDKLIIQDFDIINEFYTFAQKKLSYEAEEGQHDDLVMSLVLFGWLARQPYFKDLTDTDVRRQLAEQRYADVIEDMLPAGFISDGQEEDSLEFDLKYDSKWF